MILIESCQERVNLEGGILVADTRFKRYLI